MKWNPWQIIAGSAVVLAFMVLGALMHWFDPTVLYTALAGAVVALVAAVASRITKAIEQSKFEAETAKAKAESDVAIEKARSEIPPALQDARIVAYRPRMPTMPDLTELPPGIPAAPPSDASLPHAPTTNVTIEVKS